MGKIRGILSRALFQFHGHFFKKCHGQTEKFHGDKKTRIIKRLATYWRQCFFSPWNFSVCPWHFSKKCPWIWKSARDKKPRILPVKIDELPVTKLLKKCPWKMKSARDNFWNFARDKTKSAREKPLVFYPFFLPAKVTLFTSWEKFIGHSFIQNPKIYFFCTKKGGKDSFFFDH